MKIYDPILVIILSIGVFPYVTILTPLTLRSHLNITSAHDHWVQGVNLG